MTTPGTVVAGRYRLREVLGSGGMGRVWRGYDEVLRRDVAVKEVRPAGWGALEDRAGLREARAAARLRHPNVVAVLDVVESDRTWIVMEYRPARSLHEIVATDGPLPPREVARIGLEILAGLSAAHRAGVIHRDVKPHNVLVGTDGRVALTDFGLAVLDGGGEVTRADLVVGSPQFIAPERARDSVSTVESDLWSFGATLYAAVEGRPPYRRPTVVATLTALATAPPDPPGRAGPLAGTLRGLLDRDPARRPDADRVARRLRRIADAPHPTRRHRPWLAAAATLVALAGGAAVLTGSEPGRTTPATAAPRPLAAAPCLTGPAGRTGLGDDAGPKPLPPGWTSHRDPTGFRVAVPGAWTRATEGGAVCFAEPGGGRMLVVEPAVTPTADPAALWRAEERRLRSAGALPGYSRLGLGPLLLGRAAADWEYAWDAADGRMHARRVVVATSPTTAYALTWLSPDREWTPNQPLFLVALGSYRPIR